METSFREKIITIVGFFVLFIVVPFLIHRNISEYNYYVEQGIIEVKGVCIENDLRNKGRVIKYKFSIRDTTYFGKDNIINNIKWSGRIQPNDSILINVSSINPNYNFLD